MGDFGIVEKGLNESSHVVEVQEGLRRGFSSMAMEERRQLEAQ